MVTTITLNPAIDKTFTVKSLEYGSVNRVGKGVIETGGKGLNVSKVLGKLGDSTTAIGFIGNQNKEIMMNLLKQEKMETEFIEVPDQTRTNVIIVDEDRAITTNINEEGFYIDLDRYEMMKNLVVKYAETSDYMVFSGSAPKGIDDTVYYDLMTLVKNKCRTVLDADDEMLLEGLKASPYLIKPNIHELENAFNVTLSNDEEIIELCRKVIKEYDIKLVLISMGGEGCILITQQEAYKALPIPVEVKSTVGAGDSLVAGFVYGLHNNLSYEECLAYGTVCGAIAVARDGVGTFTPDELPVFLKQAQVQKL